MSGPLKLSDKITIRKRENLRFLTRYVLIRVKVKTVKMFIGVFSTPSSLTAGIFRVMVRVIFRVGR